MEKRDIQARGKLLSNSVANKAPTSDLLAILNELKANVKPTEQLLRDTQIGRIVNKIKGVQGLDPQVTQLASELVGRWRNIVNAQKVSSGTSTPTNGAKQTNGTAASNTTSKPSTPTPVAKASSPTGIDPAKRTWKLDKVNLELYPNDKPRNNCVGLLYDGLVQNTTYPSSAVLDKAKAIELAILTQVAKSDSSAPIYKEKIRSLYANLKNKANPTLRVSIMKGEGRFGKVDELVMLDVSELKSQEQVQQDEELAKVNMNDAMVPQEEQSISTSLECPNCHEKKVSYTQAQTRSADEPMTTFCTCLACGRRWKFS